ncbi:MAG TPA: alpha/beta fold hydrolase [Planctomycetaceae bacterium]|nr:alpha/beta fold hydrolase [Planctomycetaceae bacterium]HIQ20986.1 alpha/beta fold hydrolase [Planctomycetota bacterium]
MRRRIDIPRGTTWASASAGLFLTLVALQLGTQPLSDARAGEARPRQKPRPQQQEKEPLPQPILVRGQTLRTSDGVQLSATFFPGTKGKNTVPVILLHSWKRDRREYASLARYLQAQGHAVLVPDLRGHGASRLMTVGGSVVELDSSKMAAKDFEQMIYKDMERLKAFLVEKNDAGELNLSKLCIVGSEMGAAVALYYARYDWMLQRYEAASRRRAPAADVKAVVLLSPPWSFKGLPISVVTNHPAIQKLISILVIVGRNDSKSLADAQRLRKLLERFRPEGRGEAGGSKTLFFVDPPTRLQGARLLGVRGLNLEAIIGRFIELQLVQRDFAWRQRR